MTRILAVSDEVQDSLYGNLLPELDPDIIISCGDLPFDYLEYLVTISNVPLVWVPGNHDPSLTRRRRDPSNLFQPDYLEEAHRDPPGPLGGVAIDGRIVDVAGLRVMGLGGSLSYNEGPHQYSGSQMRWRAFKMKMKARTQQVLGGRRIDVLVTHAPPAGYGDIPDDVAHRGPTAFTDLVTALQPRWMLHGHVHPHGEHLPDRSIGRTQIANVVPYRVLEVGS